MPTLTGWEKKIRAYADDHGLTLGRSRIQRIARRVDKRHRAYVDDAVRELGSTLTYSDPTGDEAVRNVLIEEGLLEEVAA